MSWFISLNLSNKFSLISLVVAILTLIYAVYEGETKEVRQDSNRTIRSIKENTGIIINNNSGKINVEK